MVDPQRIHKMTQMDETSVLSILFANTKRKKRDVDLLTLSKHCEYLVNLYNGSQTTVAEKLGLSKGNDSRIFNSEGFTKRNSTFNIKKKN